MDIEGPSSSLLILIESSTYIQCLDKFPDILFTKDLELWLRNMKSVAQNAKTLHAKMSESFLIGRKVLMACGKKCFLLHLSDMKSISGLIVLMVR